MNYSIAKDTEIMTSYELASDFQKRKTRNFMKIIRYINTLMQLLNLNKHDDRFLQAVRSSQIKCKERIEQLAKKTKKQKQNCTNPNSKNENQKGTGR